MSKQTLAIADVRQGYDYYTVQLFTPIRGVEAELDFQRIADGDNGAIWCELSVYTIINGVRSRIIPPSRTNLMNATRSGWKGHLDTLNEVAGSLEWQEIMGLACGEAIDAYRNGAAATVLTLDQEPDRTSPFLIEPFVAASGVTVLFGEGGVGKSMLGLLAAVTVASEDHDLIGSWTQKKGPVIYFDYEDDDTVHNERLGAIARSHNITRLDHPILHYSLVAKVSTAQAHMRRLIREHQAVMVVLDSMGMGRGGDAGSAEDTIRVFRALRSLGVPVLALDHVTKDDKRKGSVATPYGSIYTVNAARLLWGARLAAASSHTERFINMENTKANRVMRQHPRGIQMNYTNDDRGRLIGVKVKQADEWWDEEDDELATAVKEIRGLTSTEGLEDE